MTHQRSGLRWIRRGYATTLVLVGAIFVVGGISLASIGGSPYYLLAGLGTIASGVGVWRHVRFAAPLYGVLLALTIIWAIWEAGFDPWALQPRLLLPLLLGVGFLFLRPAAIDGERQSRSRRGLTIATGLAAAIALGCLARAIGPADYPDPIYQTGVTAIFPARWTAPAEADGASPVGEWRNYGNDAGGSRFSPLDQLTSANVSGLRKIWEVHVGRNPLGRNSLETTPLKIGHALFLCTDYNDVLSLNAETGQINWRFHARVDMRGRANGTCRGVAYFQVPKATGLCARRIITNTIDARLIALDMDTGRPCPGFGSNGSTDLNAGMGAPDIGYYYVSSAPTIVRGRIVLGGWVNDGQYWGEPSGVVRAFDAVTGHFAWAFDLGRPNEHGEPKPGDSYTRATPNSWAPMSADPALGLVYVPTGNATPDYYGGRRRAFDERYSSAVLALDAETGAIRWAFQTTHHDLWDYDVASQPTLVDIPGPSGVQKALVQPTKRGEIFLLDRVTGRPLAPVAERPVPQGGTVPGERLAPTQPFSIGMPAFGGARLRERDMWGVSALDQLWCRISFRRARYDGPLTPPGLTPNIAYPGYLGGIDWGSASIDKDHSVLIINANRVANIDRLIPRADVSAMGIKPSTRGSPRAVKGVVAQANTPYGAEIKPFLSPLTVPCNKPPFGLISAIDLRTHKLLWSRPFGTAEESGPFGLHSHLPLPIGLPNAGGSVATRGGLIFIAATQTPALHAIDIRTGREVWRTRLPAGGLATPTVYWSAESRRQFVVVAASGNPNFRSPVGDSIVAYALPR